MEKQEKLVKIAKNIQEISFPQNNIAVVNVEGKSICIARTNKGLKACSSLCPHAGGDLSEGFIDKRGNISCPVHGYRFSLKNGRDANNEGYFLKIYKVIEAEEGIFLKLE
jgi:3-phenylpropionate/trans-cinnamate dioxygenase ferredoxin subunit